MCFPMIIIIIIIICVNECTVNWEIFVVKIFLYGLLAYGSD